MAGKVSFEVSGFKEFSASLGELKKSAQKGVLQRTLLKAGEPARDRAKVLAPKDKHDLEESIEISAKTIAETDAGQKAFGEVMRSGGSKGDAVAAMRTARRAGGSGGTYAEVYVGPKRGSKRRAIKALAQEVGSVNHPPHAYLRPALVEMAGAILDGIKRILGGEIEKAAQRAARRAAKKAARGK